MLLRSPININRKCMDTDGPKVLIISSEYRSIRGYNNEKKYPPRELFQGVAT